MTVAEIASPTTSSGPPIPASTFTPCFIKSPPTSSPKSGATSPAPPVSGSTSPPSAVGCVNALGGGNLPCANTPAPLSISVDTVVKSLSIDDNSVLVVISLDKVDILCVAPAILALSADACATNVSNSLATASL